METILLVVLGVGATVVMFANAVGRYVFKSSFVWAEEIIRVMFVWSMFVAITDSFIRNEHIGFKNLSNLNAATRAFADTVYYLSLLVVGGAVAFYGWKYNAMTGTVPLPGTNLPAAVLMLPGIIAGVIWTAVGLIRLIGLAARTFRRAGKEA
jgi:TRAP-type C4-dicarboxylate transport system permease small subunit